MNHERIRKLADVIEVQKGGVFRCRLDDNKNHEVTARLCGKMHTQNIIICVGDLVSVELSPYDLTQGRIVWRHT